MGLESGDFRPVPAKRTEQDRLVLIADAADDSDNPDMAGVNPRPSASSAVFLFDRG